MTTQFAKASYQEIIDLHTESDKVSVIGIHTPTSDTPRKMFGGFFDQFKKFKYLGCSISLVPAARLPADPLQVSYEAGEATIDPRDMLNPLMFHGCHGNDMGVILNRLYALNSIDAKKMDSVFQYEVPTDGNYDIAGFQLEDLYYKALTDNTWKKAHPQRGFKKSGLRPLVYSVATNHQLLGASVVKVGNSGSLNMDAIQGLPLEMDYELDGTAGSETMDIYSNTTSADLRFFTPRLTGLGWLDTRNAITHNVLSEGVALTTGLAEVKAAVSQLTAEQQSEPDLPLVYMGMILLPPAYKTEQYFRMIVNHHFAFKEFRGISFSNTLIDTPAYANFNDDDWTQGGDSVNPDNPDDPGDGGDDSGGGGSTSGAIVLMHEVTKQTGVSSFSRFSETPLATLPYFGRLILDDDTVIDSSKEFESQSGTYKRIQTVAFGVVDNTVRLVAYLGIWDDGYVDQYLECYLTSNGWVDLTSGNVVSTDDYPSGITVTPIITTAQYNRLKAGIDATGATLDTSSWS